MVLNPCGVPVHTYETFGAPTMEDAAHDVVNEGISVFSTFDDNLTAARIYLHLFGSDVVDAFNTRNRPPISVVCVQWLFQYCLTECTHSRYLQSAYNPYFPHPPRVYICRPP